MEINREKVREMGNQDLIQAAMKLKALNEKGSASRSDLLSAFSLLKQATEANVRSGMLDIVNRAKWDAWNHSKGMDPHEAATKAVVHIPYLL